MGQQNGKEWFSTDEVAALGKAPFTVREWCRHRRIRAKKRRCSRGNAKEWMISTEELKRIQDEGGRSPDRSIDVLLANSADVNDRSHFFTLADLRSSLLDLRRSEPIGRGETG